MKSLILIALTLIPLPALAGEKVFAFGRDAEGQRCFLSYVVESGQFAGSADKLISNLTIHKKAPGAVSNTTLRVTKGGAEFKKFTSVGLASLIEIEGDDILRPAGIITAAETCKNLRPLREEAFQTSVSAQSAPAEQHASAPAEAPAAVEIPEDFQGNRSPAFIDVQL